MRYPTAALMTLLLAACDIQPKPKSPTSFTPAAITWEAVANAPFARFEAQSAVFDGKLYAFGGYTDGSIRPVSFEAHSYDPATDAWTELPDMPRPITHAGTAVAGDSIYLAGGVVGSEDPGETRKIPATTEVWRYDTREQTWSTMPPLPEARGAGALVVLDNTLHFFGGTGTDRYQEEGAHWALSLTNDTTWEARSPLLNPRNHLAGIVVDGTIYAIGGQHGHNETLVTQASVERYDAAIDRWVNVASLPHGLGHIQSTTLELGGRIYVVGGETSDFGTYTDEVLVYDPELDVWSETTPFLSAENSLIGGAIGQSLYITGGSERNLRTLRGTLVGE